MESIRRFGDIKFWFCKPVRKREQKQRISSTSVTEILKVIEKETEKCREVSNMGRETRIYVPAFAHIY